MQMLWSALFLFASAPVVNVDADPTVPVWVTEQWFSHGPRLADAYGQLLGQEMTTTAHIIGDRPSAMPQILNINAYTDDKSIHINLEGEAWDAPTTTTRRLIQQNLAHELAHIWQQEMYDSLLEPRWLHEGFAEALSLAALERSDLWSSREVMAYRGALDDRCAAVLEQGTLLAAFERGDREATYACGFVIIDSVSTLIGKHPGALYQIYVDGLRSGKGLARTVVDATPNGHLGRLRRFIYVDYSHTTGESVITTLRSGRL